MKLNLGCGYRIREGYVNVDKLYQKGINKVWDLNKFPYPFKDNTFNEIIMEHILEHLDDIPKVMAELYRISKDQAVIEITAPHFASLSAYIDPTHKHKIAIGWFKFFNQEDKTCIHEEFNFNFKMFYQEITFPRWYFWLKYLANKFQGFYDTNLCYIFRPEYIIVKLKVVKEEK